MQCQARARSGRLRAGSHEETSPSAVLPSSPSDPIPSSWHLSTPSSFVINVRWNDLGYPGDAHKWMLHIHAACVMHKHNSKETIGHYAESLNWASLGYSSQDLCPYRKRCAAHESMRAFTRSNVRTKLTSSHFHTQHRKTKILVE